MNHNLNEDVLLLQSIERYLDNSMLPDEREYFEQLRKNSADIDQMVVEHSMFLSQIKPFAERKNMKHSLHEIHEKLSMEGVIYEGGEKMFKTKVIQMWAKYKRDAAIAASVACTIAVSVSILFSYLNPTVNVGQIQQLSKDIAIIKKNQLAQGSLINEVKSKLPEGVRLISGGTGFLIDGKGFIVTNAHVLKGNGAIVVNNKGNEFNAIIVHIDNDKDLAILQIKDDDFKPTKTLPYGISPNDASLGDEIYTLGYPRNDNAIVYTQGYLSAESGFQGDTLSCQIQMNSNPGNSGGPILDKDGEVVGILSKRQTLADGVTFAIKSSCIYSMINELKKSDTLLEKIKVTSNPTVKQKNRKTQVRKIEDYVYAVKAFNNNTHR